MTQFTLQLEPLANYGNTFFGQPSKLAALNISSLGGGYSSAAIYRVELEFRLNESATRHLPVVLKHTSETEVNVMRALGDVPGAEALPRLIDCGQFDGDELIHWFVMPFFEGAPLSTADDEMPLAVIDSLARLHAHFISRLNELAWLPRFDGAAFHGLLGWVMDRLAEAETRQADERLAVVHRVVQAARDDPSVQAAFACLPATLIHGDVHGGNILALADGAPVLIDWGNARLAPAMFDLSNMVELDSPNWRRYLAIWESVTSHPLDESLARLGHHLGTVLVNTQYLPFVVRNWPDDADAPQQAMSMIERLEIALGEIKTGCHQ
jgi:aminoglycoside phosphotransferase (APT) family kinase protein